MLRVLLMIDEATPGGGQAHLLELAQRLDRTKFDVVVSCASSGYLVDELHRRGIRTFSLRMTNVPNPGSIVRAVRLLRNIRPSILHTHGGTAGFVGRVAALFTPSVSAIHTYHGIHYLHNGSFRSRLFRYADILLKFVTDALICVSKSDFDLGREKGVVDVRKTSLIRNGVDVGKFSPSISNRRKTGGRTLVGTIGRLHVQKGHRHLIEAVRMVLARHPETEFLIVGDGPLRGELELQIRSLGLEHSVALAGERTDISEVLSEFDIFALPSLWEGLPLVLLEAMSAELPIVATAVDGVNEVLTDGVDGLLVPPADARALANGIIRLLEGPDLCEHLRKNAFRKVRSEFGVERMVHETEELYLKIGNEVRQ